MIDQPLPATNHFNQSVTNHGWRLWFSRHNWLTWLGLCFILPLVIYYWQHYSEHLRQQQQAVFQQHADNIEHELQQRLKHIELLLGANAAYVSSSEYVSQDEWQHYVESLNLAQVYPGIQALGVVSYRRAVELPVLLGQLTQEIQRQHEAKQQSAARSEQQAAELPAAGLQKTVPPTVTLYPAGNRSHYAIVSHIQPATPQNRKVIGYDMLTDPQRTQTAMRAASLNQPAITAKVSLQQDGGASQVPGLVLVLPLYHPNAALATAEQKQTALLGFVYAAFRVGDILPPVWHDPATVLPDIQWSSGFEPEVGQLLFERSSDTSATTASVALQQHRHLDWYGQPFVLQIKNNPLFERELLPLAEYELVFMGSAALLLLFLLLSYLNLRRYQAECHSSQLQHHVQQQRQLLLLDEQRQSLALKASQLAWFEFDLRSGGAFYADIWWRMFDFAAPQPNPEPQQLFDLVHPSALAMFRQDLQRLLAHGPDQEQQHYRFVSRQGRQLYCLVNFYVVRAPEGDAIRLCCTIQDQTVQQQQATDRQRLAVLCQLEVSLAFELACQSAVFAGDLTAESRFSVAAAANSSAFPTELAIFLQQHSAWLLQLYCEALTKTDGHSAAPIEGGQPPRLLAVAQLVADAVQFYQPQATAGDLTLTWLPHSVSELLKVDRHRYWQMTCGLLQLAGKLAMPGSRVTIDLMPYQTRLALRLQLQMTAVTAQQFQQEATTQAFHHTAVQSFTQQRLLAAQFWASQLAAEFTYQQDQQQLSLQLLFYPAGHLG